MFDFDDLTSHYETLGVAENATFEEIKVAYRNLSSKYHPDRNQGDEMAARMMQCINDAYAVLSDPAKRAEYDLTGDVEKSSPEDRVREMETEAPKILANLFLNICCSIATAPEARMLLPNAPSPTKTDIIGILQNSLNEQHRGIRESIGQTENQIAKLKVMRDRLRVKSSLIDPKQSPLGSALYARLRQLQQDLRQHNYHLELNAILKRLSADYSYEIDSPTSSRSDRTRPTLSGSLYGLTKQGQE